MGKAGRACTITWFANNNSRSRPLGRLRLVLECPETMLGGRQPVNFRPVFRRRFAELGERAPLAWVVPLANVDGVEQGDYGKDNFPYDLNRAWGHPPMRHETLIFHQDLRRWARRCRSLAGFDFHAPGAGENAGIYAFLHVLEKLPEVAKRASDWAAALAESLGPEFAAPKFIRSGDYPSRWNTPRLTVFCHEEMQIPGLALETPYALIQQTVLTRETYREAGRRIADAAVHRAQSPD